jgi:carboxymethylenebutenolidase
MPGYLARPASGAPSPAVIVVQEWWGIDEHIKDIARRLAAEGYVALAPDLYRGQVTNEPTTAEKLMMQLDVPRATDELVHAASWLRQQPYVSAAKMGAIGFCMGGGLVTSLASNSPEIGAGAAFYGVVGDPIDQVKGISGKLLAIYAEHDDWADQASAQALEAKLEEYGKEYEIVTYPGTHHAFFNDTGEAFNREARDDAWVQVKELFAETLR